MPNGLFWTVTLIQCRLMLKYTLDDTLWISKITYRHTFNIRWIESLNTVMDDNKILTLASNERIALTPTMRLIFEISNLRTATPATVTRFLCSKFLSFVFLLFYPVSSYYKNISFFFCFILLGNSKSPNFSPCRLHAFRSVAGPGEPSWYTVYKPGWFRMESIRYIMDWNTKNIYGKIKFSDFLW